MNNPQAFPLSLSDDVGGGANVGMTLRDYFAAQAITGILSYYEGEYNSAAVRAYLVADAMLEARDKTYVP